MEEGQERRDELNYGREEGQREGTKDRLKDKKTF